MTGGANCEHLQLVLEAREQSPVLQQATSRFYGAVELDSPEAEKMRRYYHRGMESEAADRRREEKRRALSEQLAESIEQHLVRIKEGEVGAWWFLNRLLTIEPGSQHFGDDLECDLTRLPGWSVASNTTRTRVIDAARRYLEKSDPPSWEGHDWDGLDFRDLAGVKALVLLLTKRKNYLRQLRKEDWAKWTQALLTYPSGSTESLLKALDGVLPRTTDRTKKTTDTPDGSGPELHVEDAAGDVMHTVIHYDLA